MRKLSSLFLVLCITLIAGYAFARHHHVPSVYMSDDALELFLVQRLDPSASLHSTAKVVPVSYDAPQTGMNDGPDITLIRQTIKKLEDELKKSGQESATAIETWSTCVENKNVTLTYTIFEDKDKSSIQIDTVKAK